MPNPNYPSTVNVTRPNDVTVEFIRELDTRPSVVAEIGCYQGHTSAELLGCLPPDGELHLYDFTETAEAVADRLADPRVRVFGNTERVLDSYNWPLMKTLEANKNPIYDYVFIDGAHTWHHDALAFLIADRLLRPGGHMDFDDYGWSLKASPSLNPDVFPKTAEWYSDEQIATQQVALVVELLVRRDPRYVEVVKNKIFRKN